MHGGDIRYAGSKIGFLLIHGFTATTVEVSKLAKHLHMQGFSVLAPLLPGHNTTPQDLNKTKYTEWISTVESAYKELDTACDYVLVCGESMGGVLSLYLGENYPQISALVLFSTALLVGKLPTSPSRMRARRMVRQVLELRANALAIWHATLTPPFFEEMRRRAVSVWTWTGDEESIMRDMALMGGQGIITNYPDRLNRVLEEMEDEGGIQPPLGRRRRLKRSRWGRRRRLRKMSAARRSG